MATGAAWGGAATLTVSISIVRDGGEGAPDAPSLSWRSCATRCASVALALGADQLIVGPELGLQR